MFEHNNTAPKYHQLKEYLKNRILSGEILPGEKLDSENTLARRFKLSRHTVRQALGELENEGLIYREKGRGSFCNPAGKNSVQNIAVLTTYISDYIFPSIIRGIEEVLSKTGCNLLLANTNNDKAKEAQCLENFLKQEVDALIIEPTKSAMENTNEKLLREFEAKGIPHLMLNACYRNFDSAYLIVDDTQGTYLASKYLIQLGHRQIAGLFKSDDLQGVNRQKGFLKALHEAGLSKNPNFLGHYTTEQFHSYPYQFVRNLLRKENRPTGIVCYNDQVALKVLEAIRDEGLKVPDDISITGFDDSTLATATEIKLTTIKHPKTEMGRQAAHNIIEMLAGRIEKPRFIYHPELIVRASCRNIE